MQGPTFKLDNFILNAFLMSQTIKFPEKIGKQRLVELTPVEGICRIDDLEALL